ncbi:hypothetical protein RhiirA4_390703 [Rhizophagus irregularis]|uniref:Uncharacterized protein n=1 Tax=Rhizophagus irregularis TaxID=588596 RepID=A0A2I1FTA9_9GLOM|nr:hypothetical protein RhiirA4_390703 [Rhizophagus irregularis]
MSFQEDKVIPLITVEIKQLALLKLPSKIRTSFNNVPLDIRQIHPGSVIERRIQSQALISD